MFMIEDFSFIADDVSAEGSAILDLDFDKFDKFYMSCYKGDIFSAGISCMNLQTDNPCFSLRTSYIDIDDFCKVECFNEPTDIKVFILKMIDKINNDFNEEAYTYFCKDEWLGSDLYNVLSEIDYHISNTEYNKVIGHVADIIGVGCLDFKLD